MPLRLLHPFGPPATGDVGIDTRDTPAALDGDPLPVVHDSLSSTRLEVEEFAVGYDDNPLVGATHFVAEVHIVEVDRQRLGEPPDLVEGVASDAGARCRDAADLATDPEDAELAERG